MRLMIDTEPETGASYDDLLRLATVAERCNFGGFYCADHYLTPSGGSTSPPGPVDAWTTLAGLARDTRRLRLGTLVSPATFRRPGPMAIMVAQVDNMSGGRVDLGLGTGHGVGEHEVWGIPFPPLGERFEILEEQLAIITGLWATPPDQRFSFHGKHFTVENAYPLPRPLQQPRVPITVGGRGPVKTPSLAARFADEINVSYVTPGDLRESFDRARAACEAIGRDPATLRCTTTQLLCCGKDDAELQLRRQRALGRMGANRGSYPTIDRVAGHAAIGLPAQVTERLLAYVAAGAERVYLHCYDHDDTEHLELVAAEVMPHIPGNQRTETGALA